MKPFNLERALSGDPVVTRLGEPVEQFHKFEAKFSTDVLFGVIGGIIRSWTKNGKYYDDDDDDCTESPYDLFMAPMKKEGWINIYPRNKGYATSKTVFDSKEKAYLGSMTTRVAAVKIEWEE